ncbi:hypothetical protein MGU_01322 [Metarhizium guizhouense ARSEF 977]|uniref:CorA-like transporter domain-containing protein n=1 Tax=Metarhizium guizhouense (strain ARSEF 977) TaxID=1276136 RepID=A0A0B4HGG4_METGA|nr:hypothetical protein MGU_01322 [Metarhizium guizhouense ARSEF 977]
MARPPTATDQTIMGGLGAQTHGDTLPDVDRFRNLLLRVRGDRKTFWSHSFQDPEMQLICCGDEHVRVHVTSHLQGSKVQETVVDRHEQLGQAPSGKKKDRGLFVFIDSDAQASGKLSISHLMFHQLISRFNVMPQFSDLLPWKVLNQTYRDSITGGFSSSMEDGEEMCLSLYYCHMQQANRGEVPSISVTRAILYIQARPEVPRWIVIGHPVLWNLRKASSLDFFSSSTPFIAFIATNGWHMKLSSIFNDFAAVANRAGRPTSHNGKTDLYDLISDFGHADLIDGLSRVQNQLRDVNWQIQTNTRVLRRFSQVPASGTPPDQDLLSAALEEIKHVAARAEFITHQVNNAMEQATRLMIHGHGCKLEMLAWRNLRVDFSIRSHTQRVAIIFALIAPAIFTSTFFSTHFVSPADGSIAILSDLWIWFAITIPLTVLSFSMVWPTMNIWHRVADRLGLYDSRKG